MLVKIRNFFAPKPVKEYRRAIEALETFHREHGRRDKFVRGQWRPQAEEHHLSSKELKELGRLKDRVRHWQNHVSLRDRGGRHDY